MVDQSIHQRIDAIEKHERSILYGTLFVDFILFWVFFCDGPELWSGFNALRTRIKTAV